MIYREFLLLAYIIKLVFFYLVLMSTKRFFIQHHKITFYFYCLNRGFKFYMPIAIAHVITTLAMVFIHISQMQIDACHNASANRKVASKSHMFYTPEPWAGMHKDIFLSLWHLSFLLRQHFPLNGTYRLA